MKLTRITALLALGLLGASVGPTLASAAEGYVTADVHERAGPSTGYPIITVIPDGAGITIHGCLSSRSWCDVSWDGNRGWVSSNYIDSTYHSRRVPITNYYSDLGIPFLTFDLGTYWGNHYRGRSFYHHRSRWENNHHHHHNNNNNNNNNSNYNNNQHHHHHNNNNRPKPSYNPPQHHHHHHVNRPSRPKPPMMHHHHHPRPSRHAPPKGKHCLNKKICF